MLNLRLANNRKVYKLLSEQEKSDIIAARGTKRGAPPIYGACLKLSNAGTWDLKPDKVEILTGIFANERQVIYKVSNWNNMAIRTTGGIDMKNTSFRLVRVECYDAKNQELVFKRPLWLSVWGSYQGELSLQEKAESYKSCFEIEKFFRFAKQNLGIDTYQTSCRECLQNWLHITSITAWLVNIARTEINSVPEKWQKYNLKKDASGNPVPSLSQTMAGLNRIFLSSDFSAYMPKTIKKSKGREKGKKQTPRKRYPYIIKAKKTRAVIG